MKTRTTTGKDTRWTRPGRMSHEDFIAQIERAEKGSFYSVQESMQRFEEWLKSREKR